MSATSIPSDVLPPGLHRLDMIPATQAIDLLASFQCGQDVLDGWLARRAATAERLGTARTFVMIGPAGTLDGFFCLSSATLMRERLRRAAERQGMPGHVPAILLGRLAVAATLQGQGIGSILLAHALEQACRAAHGPAAATMVLVHPIDAAASRFYAKFDFRPLGGSEPAEGIEPAMYLPITTAAKLVMAYRQG